MSLKIVIVFFAVLTSLVFLGLIITIIILNSGFNKSFKKQNEKFSEEKVDMQLQIDETQISSKKEERERILANFHDDINPLFAVLKYQLRLFHSDAKEKSFNYNWWGGCVLDYCHNYFLNCFCKMIIRTYIVFVGCDHMLEGKERLVYFSNFDIFKS
jgi:hypothetical protein